MLSGFAGLVSAAADGVHDFYMVAGLERNFFMLAAWCNFTVELNSYTFTGEFQLGNQCGQRCRRYFTRFAIQTDLHFTAPA